jgi:ABC-type lipoprotein release transport system permease subunit
MLVGVRAWDPLTLGASGIVLILVSFPAAWFPARRAASVDPMKALRME